MAPRIGPTSVPAPPTITMMSTWPESSQNRSFGVGEAGEGRIEGAGEPA